MADLTDLISALAGERVKQQIEAENPYRAAQPAADILSALAVEGAKNPGSYDTGELMLTAALGGLGSGVLDTLGGNYTANRTADYSNVLASLIRGQNADQGDLSDALFRQAGSEANLFNLQKEIQLEQEVQKRVQNQMEKLFQHGLNQDLERTKARYNNPVIAKMAENTYGGNPMAASAATSTESAGAIANTAGSDIASEDTGKPGASIVPSTIDDMYERSFQKNLQRFGDIGEANKRAAQEVKPFEDMRAKDLEKVKELNDSIFNMSSRLQGVGEAIENLESTGLPGQDLIRATNRINAYLSDDTKYEDYLRNTAVLDSLRSVVTNLYRTAGEGTITQEEVKNFATGLPSRDKSQAENRAILQRLGNFLELSSEYANALNEVSLKGRLGGAQEKLSSLKSRVLQAGQSAVNPNLSTSSNDYGNSSMSSPNPLTPVNKPRLSPEQALMILRERGRI